MSNNEKDEIVRQEILEELNSHKRKFDNIAEKLQSIEESISKIPKIDDDEKKLIEDSNVLNNRNNKKLESGKRFVLKHVFKNVVNLGNDVSYSAGGVEHFNINWYMAIERNESFLEFYFYFKTIAPVGDDWSIDTKVEFRMMGNNNNNVIKTARNCFKTEEEYGFGNFLDLRDLNDYLINDNLTAEVEIEILKMTGFEKKRIRKFDESQKDVSDVILVVKDTKFYVLKMYLAAQSSLFKALFLGNFSESKMTEIPLTGIEPEDFQHFLEVLYGEPSIDDTTVEGVTLLADMYDAPTAKRRCEEFLLEKSKKTLKKKLQLASRYHMEKLKEKSMGEIKSIEDIRSVIPENVDDYDHQTTFELLGKFNFFH
ncbi:hypothetical protein L5515_015089 [Caenorhabditis briggsae]|uniref:BTB domain-containing protein n=1 Tax=Caenorhabditis briggsae TaxID=6238 RepID=A0AAE9EF11_CAEBR|nr:hypothetical protein L5515_015089 [Caenorhabditis briggsae]